MFIITLNQVNSTVMQGLDTDIIQGRMKHREKQMENVIEKYKQYLEAAYPNGEEISSEDEDWFNIVSVNYDTVEAGAFKKMKGSSQTRRLKDGGKRMVRRCSSETAPATEMWL